ncbi:hypothetical protein P154DRAFT_440129 [Amniculicola lignicola CBS 123094]|uniref:Uncharacterized protein n=1 Tax=Amniculicola lignicola CBS 123094 TaxID=1392246 RepID=A0A6A5WJY8_9PLEO|nr:hypothetical protein P154DRAFT_440129 [Amniculicola lignicola CBS 123094]
MAANGIPLHCNICPKRPNFSDVSHLLTHIASKGHLSNYYKVKVRSGTEDASRRIIESYDRWYAEWNVEELMSDRMNQKDKRRNRPKPPGIAPAPRSARPRVAVSSLLDPRLVEQQSIKIENSFTPTPPPLPNHPAPAHRPRPFAPHMQYWPTASRSTSHSFTNPDYDTSSEFSDPSERRRHQYAADDSCAIEDDPADTISLSTEDPMVVSECTKLKGVYWPGMDLFDSATPEMRRKRNQKKDSSVVEQLELNSLDVEPAEFIFTPRGSFKKQRRISGSVYDDEESSPIRGASPRQHLARPVLADLDVNRNRRSRPLVRPPPFPLMARNSRYGDEAGQSDYNYGEHTQRRKRAFDVFQDDDVAFSQPSGYNYLSAPYHRHQLSPTPTSAFPPYKAYNDTYQYENKENVLPPFHPAFDHHHSQPPGYNYPYGIGHEQHAYHYHNHMYMSNAYHPHRIHEDTDDQRTLTAPPSPSTG